MDDSEITWQEQAETFQTLLESALEHQRSLEEEIRNLVCSLQVSEQQIHEAEQRHEDAIQQRDQVISNQAKERTFLSTLLQVSRADLERLMLQLQQRDQVISGQAKEIAHVSHILQIQQQLLRTRKIDAK